MEVKKNKKLALIAASVAGLLAVTGGMIKNNNAQAADDPAPGDRVACYGVNQCKGTGECGGKGFGCAGKNACKGQGFVKMAKEECLKTEGGRLTAEEKA